MADDGRGYRSALINAFRLRGIRPEGIVSYSDEALSWDTYKGVSSSSVNPNFRKLFKDLNEFEDEPDQKHKQQLYERLWGRAATFRRQLGLPSEYPVQAKSLNPLHRVRPDGSLQRQIVAELVQKRDRVEIEPGNPKAGKFTFRGGTTLIINRLGEVRFSISKPIEGKAGEARLRRQREYLSRMADSFALAPYVAFNHDRDLGFRGIHRGY